MLISALVFPLSFFHFLFEDLEAPNATSAGFVLGSSLHARFGNPLSFSWSFLFFLRKSSNDFFRDPRERTASFPLWLDSEPFFWKWLFSKRVWDSDQQLLSLGWQTEKEILKPKVTLRMQDLHTSISGCHFGDACKPGLGVQLIFSIGMFTPQPDIK